MPAFRPLYLVLSAFVLAALAGAVFLVWSYRPPADPSAAGAPTPTAEASPSGVPADTAPPNPTPTGTTTTPEPGLTPSPTAPRPLGAKETLAASVDPEELTGYVWPARHAIITSRFAPREFAGFVIIDGKEIHDGLDVATHCGNKVRAAHDGTVLYAGRNFDPYIGYWGDPNPIYARLERLGRVKDQPIVVVIDDGNGYRSVYVHLAKALVEAGISVKAGDVIALEGDTGFATGCHLHYGLIRMDGPWQEVVPRLGRLGYPPFVRERVDPLKVLPWGDPFAPQRLQDRVNGTPSPSRSTSASPIPLSSSPPSPSPTPTGTT